MNNIRLAASLCSVYYAQPYVFQIIEKNLYDMAHFRGNLLFPGWFQVMTVVSWPVSDNFWIVSDCLDGFRFLRSFQVLVNTETFLYKKSVG